MPSVEMRRSTRVFVPKAKDGELVRVLRSGRRLWVDSSNTPDKTKHPRANHSMKNAEEEREGLEWFPIIANHESFKPSFVPRHKHEEEDYKAANGWHDEEKSKPEPKPELMEVDEEKPKVAQEVDKTSEAFEDVCRSGCRVIRNVYSRKRKRGSGVFDGNRGGRKFGLHFVRRQRRKSVDSLVEKGREVGVGKFTGGEDVLAIVIESNCAGCNLTSRLLESALRHLGSRSVGLEQLSTFLVSNQISSVFASFGIRFLWNRPCMVNRGVCRIFGERESMLLFTVDFSAVPLCFLEVHATLSLRSLLHSYLLWMDLHKKHETNDDADDEPLENMLICCDEPLLDSISEVEPLVSSSVAPERDDSRGMKIVVTALEANKAGSTSNRNALAAREAKKVGTSLEANKLGNTNSRNVQSRSGVLTRSASKRRRRSMRNRRARNPSQFVMQNPTGLHVCNPIAFKKGGVKLPAPVGPAQALRRSARKDAAGVINVPKSSASSVSLSVDLELQQWCSGNLLVVETDKGYRIEGVEVVLDLAASNEWVLAVRKDGLTKYSLKAQKEMRPNTTNRFTHAVVWAAENGWKLEFPNRKDWLVFKELYKVCGERNIVSPSPVVKFIPVPEVSEVANFGDSTSVRFERPESYIRMTCDELSRILLRRTANYDMDSEDEGWLSEFNNGLGDANLLSDETFELMIDAFEKAAYCSPEDVRDEKAAAGVCSGLVSPEVLEPVYRYWMKRRKQKRAPLLRVFEINEPKRAQVISKPVLRKKRSLKRTTSYLPMQRGRGKDSNVLQAMAAEQTVAEEQHSVLRVQETRASADRLVELATVKRQRAQFLMENADLAIYRATMALRIAEAATQVDSKEAAAQFLD